jgi:hypothetical protein
MSSGSRGTAIYWNQIELTNVGCFIYASQEVRIEIEKLLNLSMISYQKAQHGRSVKTGSTKGTDKK